MARLILPAILGVMALIAASWALGELLRQRKDAGAKTRRARKP